MKASRSFSGSRPATRLESGPLTGVRSFSASPRRTAFERQMVGAGKGLAAADRPGDRRRVERQLLLDLVEDLEGVARLAVHLVDEGDDRNVAQAADLEQFQRARLDALGAVDHHDGEVDGRQRAVGVVGKVLVARRVEQVEDVVAILEGHHRGDDRDAALALDLHPVRAGLDAILLGLDLAGELDGAAEQQQLFRQRRLAGVRVGDDREGAPARNRLSDVFSQCEDVLIVRGLIAGTRPGQVERKSVPWPPRGVSRSRTRRARQDRASGRRAAWSHCRRRRDRPGAASVPLRPTGPCPRSGSGT